MAVIKEWRCAGHGVFESTEPVCPAGCTFGVERVFLTPPGLAFGVAKRTDALLEGVARDHGLSDMNNRGGKAARVLSASEQKQMSMHEAMQKRFGVDRGGGWGAVGQGGVYHADTRTVENPGPGAVGTVQALGATDPGVNVAEMAQSAGQRHVNKIFDKRDPNGARERAAVVKAAA